MVSEGDKYATTNISQNPQRYYPRPFDRWKSIPLSDHGSTYDLWSTIFNKLDRTSLTTYCVTYCRGKLI